MFNELAMNWPTSFCPHFSIEVDSGGIQEDQEAQKYTLEHVNCELGRKERGFFNYTKENISDQNSN